MSLNEIIMNSKRVRRIFAYPDLLQVSFRHTFINLTTVVGRSRNKIKDFCPNRIIDFLEIKCHIFIIFRQGIPVVF